MLADVRADSGAEVSHKTRVLVKQAADQLLTEGVRPTVASIRSRIGRGSAGTINDALREWWQELSQRLAAARSKPDLPAPIVEAVGQLWDDALSQADEALGEHRREADKVVTKATEAADAALLARDDAEKKFQALQQDHGRLEETRLELERRLAAATERRQIVELRIQEIQVDAERRIQEVGERMRHLEELLKREGTRYDHTEKRLTLQVDEQKTARSKVEAKYKEDAATWREEKNKLLESNQQLHQRIAGVNGQLSVLQDQLAALQEERSALNLRQDQLVAETAELHAKSTQGQKVEESLRSELGALQRSMRVIEEDRAAVRRDLELTRQALVDKSSQN